MLCKFYANTMLFFFYKILEHPQIVIYRGPRINLPWILRDNYTYLTEEGQ